RRRHPGRAAEAPLGVVDPAARAILALDQEVLQARVVGLIAIEIRNGGGAAELVGNRAAAIGMRRAPRVDLRLGDRLRFATDPVVRFHGQDGASIRRRLRAAARRQEKDARKYDWRAAQRRPSLLVRSVGPPPPRHETPEKVLLFGCLTR